MPAGSKTWLVTGASSGLGAAIARAALDAAHTVIGTTRDVHRAAASFPDFERHGGTWLALDPGQPDAGEQMSKLARERDIDVLVNSAGYAFIGGIEDTSEAEVRDQMEVNFYGPLRLVKALLPSMRARKTGEIVLISSGAGFMARPGRSSYSASKFAIEAVHESLAHEVQPLGIRVLIVEPGAFRTAFAASIKTPAGLARGFSDAYADTPVAQMLAMMRGVTGIPDAYKGDPVKAARAIVGTVDAGHDFLRLPLGSDCVAAMEAHIGELQRDLDATRSTASGTDVD